MAIHSSGQTVFGFTYIEAITLNSGEDVDEVAVESSGMGVDRIVEDGDTASEGRADGRFYSGVSGKGMTRDGMRGGALSGL